MEKNISHLKSELKSRFDFTIPELFKLIDKSNFGFLYFDKYS